MHRKRREARTLWPGALVQCDTAEHFRAHRQDEREPVVALHSTDGDADEIAAAIEDAAARHTGCPSVRP